MTQQQGKAAGKEPMYLISQTLVNALRLVLSQNIIIDLTSHPAGAGDAGQVLAELVKWAEEIMVEQKAIRDNGRYVHPRIMQAHIDQLDAVIWKIGELRQQQQEGEGK